MRIWPESVVDGCGRVPPMNVDGGGVVARIAEAKEEFVRKWKSDNL